MATNYGLLDTAAQGIREGLAAYQTTQQMKRNNQVQNLALGLQQDDQGNIQYTPEKQGEVDSERKAKSLAAKFQQKEYGEATDAQKGILRQHMNMVKPGSGDAADFTGLSYHDLKDQEGLLAPDVSGHYAVQAAGAKATAGQSASALGRVSGLLESARGNPAAAQAERDLYSSQKINSLVGLYGDPSKLTQNQVNMLAGEVGKMATGGAPSLHELQGISPNTLTGAMSSITQRFTNDPTPANAAAFVKQYKDYSDGIASDAKKVIQDKYGRVIEGNKRMLTPDDYQTLNDQYVNRFNKSDAKSGLMDKSQGGGHPQDSAAVAWAKANLKDPRSAAILKANGL